MDQTMFYNHNLLEPYPEPYQFACFLEQWLASVFILPSQLAFESTSSQIEEFWKHRVQIGLRATCNDT